jgi:hypothetical protein
LLETTAGAAATAGGGMIGGNMNGNDVHDGDDDTYCTSSTNGMARRVVRAVARVRPPGPRGEVHTHAVCQAA